MEWNLGMSVFALGGFVLHFLSRWGEFWRTSQRINPWAYARLDVPAWLFALLATILGVPIVSVFLPLDPASIPDAAHRLKLELVTALSLGFNASSLAAKLPNLAAAGARSPSVR